MKATRRALAVATGAAALVAGSGTAASAQTHIVPTITPVRTDGGWIYWLAFLSLGLGALLLLVLIALYMRFAPRFTKDEDQSKVVRADRVVPGGPSGLKPGRSKPNPSAHRRAPVRRRPK